jgi:hypothetical protein
MTEHKTEATQRTAARIAGWTLLLLTASPVLSHLATLPIWLRFAVAAGIGYGLERLLALVFAR